MANNQYDSGTLVRCKVAFTDVNGAAIDPTAVTCAVLRQDGTTVTPAPTPVKDSVGNYHADVDTTGGPAGVWSYRFSGTGAAEATADSWFYVKVPGF